MSHTVQAGDTLTIIDSVGDDVSVVAQEHPAVLAFLVAYDSLRSARNSSAFDTVALKALGQEVEKAFLALPGFVRRELPSGKLRRPHLRF